MRPKHAQKNPPLANLTVTGAGIPTQTYNEAQHIDPLAGLTDEQKRTYFLESLLYYAQLNAPSALSPHSKGVYYLLAYTPLSLLGLHKFYIGKVMHGIILQCLTVIFGWLTWGYGLPLVSLGIFICVCIETHRDWTRKSPIRDAAGRPLR